MKFKWSYLVILVAFFPIMVTFQNCSEFKNASGDSASINPEGPNATGLAFYAGQQYEASLVPHNENNDTFVTSINAYGSWDHAYKAIAINEQGDGIALGGSVNQADSQEEWNRVVLERCQLFYNNLPCSLFAVGDIIAFDEPEFYQNYIDRFLDIPVDFDASRLPGVPNQWREYAANNYLGSTNDFIAMAVSTFGVSHKGWSAVSQAEANRRALEFCEAISYSAYPCFIHTEGSQTIWDPSNTQTQPLSINYAPFTLTNISQIPFITDQQRQTLIAPAFVNAMNFPTYHFLIVMGRFGRFVRTYAVNGPPLDDAFRARSLADCDARVAADFPPETPGGFQERCFIYSEDFEVQMTPDDYGSAVHFWHPDNQN